MAINISMTFNDLYKNLVVEAITINTIFEYIDDDDGIILNESINDSSKLKCIILAGSPYSGKSFVGQKINTFIPTTRVVNTDRYFERHGNVGLAKTNTVNQTSLHVNSMLPLIIDTTSWQPERMIFRLGALAQLGYDISFCLVTSPWEDLERRFSARQRTVPKDVVKTMYDNIYTVSDDGEIQMNPTYKSVISRFFDEDHIHVYDNSSTADERKNVRTLKSIQRFFLDPLKNTEGKNIIKRLHDTGGKYLTDTGTLSMQEINSIISLWYRK